MLAKAGIQGPMLRMVLWIPACAGVTIPQCDVAATFANLRNEVLVAGGCFGGQGALQCLLPILVLHNEQPFILSAHAAHQRL